MEIRSAKTVYGFANAIPLVLEGAEVLLETIIASKTGDAISSYIKNGKT